MLSPSDVMMSVVARIRNLPATLGILAAAAASHKRAAAGVGAAVVLVAAAVVLTAWLVRPAAPPNPESQSPDEVRSYLASEEFSKHSEPVRQEYLDKVIASATPGAMRRSALGQPRDLTDEQRRRLRQNVQPLMQNMIQQRIDQYFELPEQQRAAYMDKLIDEMMAWRPRPQSTPPAETPQPQPAGSSTQQRPGHDRGRGFSPQRLKEYIESTPPETRAKLVEFMKAFRERMEQRGISFPGQGQRHP